VTECGNVYNKMSTTTTVRMSCVEDLHLRDSRMKGGATL